MDKLCAVIMAGGKGTRFWPLSTEEKPKQFLNLLGDDSMLRMTFDRLEKIIPKKQIFVSTDIKYADLVIEQLPELNVENIIVEPYGMNTGPSIALAAFHINEQIEDATLVMVPSDHLINDEAGFYKNIKEAKTFVEIHKDNIVTIGVEPSRPETGYGYINFLDKEIEENVYKVNKFIEKPNKERAKELIESGDCLWNAGIFVWKADLILNLTKKHMKKSYEVLSNLFSIPSDMFLSELKKNYKNVDNISVDYGIMEHTDNIYVVKSSFKWDDVGSWTSVERYSDKDEFKNVTLADTLPYKSTGNIVLTNKTVLLNNVENLIIVETEDYIMVSSKENEQEIKTAKEQFNI